MIEILFLDSPIVYGISNRNTNNGVFIPLQEYLLENDYFLIRNYSKQVIYHNFHLE